jgi:hypothetical protein|tara:strand:- start:485 stop:997 length:513 start_codon:yes stop_codon:yes gene_type:complete
MSAFAGIENASVGGGSSRNFEPGSYLVRLAGLKVIESKRNQGTQYAIVECSVMTFAPGVKQHLDDSIAPTPVPPETFRAGDEVAWKVNLGLGSAMDNLKAFGLAVMRAVALENGQDPKTIGEEQITPAVMDTLFAPNGSPAIGVEMKAEAFNIFTRAGNPFTKLRWSEKR